MFASGFYATKASISNGADLIVEWFSYHFRRAIIYGIPFSFAPSRAALPRYTVGLLTAKRS